MMKSILTLAALFASSTTYARSVHPCTPVVSLKPIYISCVTTTAEFVSVVVRTFESPKLEMCTGDNFFSFVRADVKVSDSFGNELSSSVLKEGEFDFSLSPTGDATFASDKLPLDIARCVTPLQGGISFAN
jgi:hypothetical protein